jgi:hypothetical protein
MPFSTKSWAYCPSPSSSSHSAIGCICRNLVEAPPARKQRLDVVQLRPGYAKIMREEKSPYRGIFLLFA